MSARPAAYRANCRPGRSCASAAPRSRRPRSRMRSDRARSRAGKTCFSQATGLIPGCRRPLRGRCGRETAPPIWCWRCCGRDRDHSRFRYNRASHFKSFKGMSSQMHSVSKLAGIETGAASDAALEASIASATSVLLDDRRPDGHWVFELEADSTIPAEYILLRYYLGDPADASHMARARGAIRSRGGAIHSNVFTRFMLAMFGVMTWRSVPVLPVEIMLLPMWSPFHINKISYWARTTIVPLMVLAALKPRAQNVGGIGID